MTAVPYRRVGLVLLGLLSVGLVLSVNGALPGIASPTLGQAVWTTGFAQSYANQALLTVYAENFGAPEPAAIAFGLSGAYPTGALILLGLHPVDAYATMVAAWLLAAFAGASFFARRIGLRAGPSMLAAALWLCLPVVWVHAGYSMLSLGIALLPTYVLSVLLLFERTSSRRAAALRLLFFLACCQVSVFMDGYTFVMFTVAAAACMAARMLRPGPSERSPVIVAAQFVLGFGLAYLLYARFQNALEFGGHDIEMFRGWGVDLTFLMQPTRNTNWLADWLSVSVRRTDQNWFGDASVWTTTYCLPFLIAAAMASIAAPRKGALWLAFLLMAGIGLYFSLGPSLKVNSQKPPSLAAVRPMPAELAVAQTGSAIISTYVPGFREMRAAYRWIALGNVGLLGLVLLGLVGTTRRPVVQYAALLTLVALYVPKLPDKVEHNMGLRETFARMDRDIQASFGESLRSGERVAFLPYRNDFLVNFLAARLRINAYNIGGDKNLKRARQSWPEEMAELEIGQIDATLAERVRSLLLSEKADAVVLPYIDMHLAANEWPYPSEYRDELAPTVATLSGDPRLDVTVRETHATVRKSKAHQ